MNIDARFQQFLDILPALGMARALDIGVRQFVDQDQGGAALERGVQVEFLEGDATVVDGVRGQDFQALQEGGGFGASVRFTQPTTTSTPSARRSRAASSMA